jgi:hypothetical protein
MVGRSVKGEMDVQMEERERRERQREVGVGSRFLPNCVMLPWNWLVLDVRRFLPTYLRYMRLPALLDFNAVKEGEGVMTSASTSTQLHRETPALLTYM